MEPALARAYYKRFWYPILRPHQSVWVVPGMFGPAGQHADPQAMAAQDANLVDKLNGFWDWACDDQRVTGMMPWHFNDLRADFYPSYTVLGGRSYPNTMRRWAEVRQAIG